MALVRWQSRGRAGVLVGALAALVLSAGIVAGITVRPGHVRLTSDAKLGLSELSRVPLAEEAAVPAPTGPPPSPAATPAVADLQAAPALPGHRTPGAVVVPFASGRSEWSGVSNGISLRIAMIPPTPRAGESVTFVAEASMPGGLCCNLTLQSGDGGGDAYPPTAGLGEYRCSSQEPKGASVRGELHHVYNKAGRWNFSVTARSGSVCSPTAVAYGSLEGTVAIGGGGVAPSPQGPSQPTVRPASVAPYERYVITLTAEAKDDDGFIDRLTVNWGDGSPTEAYSNPRLCRTAASGWPEGSYTILPMWMGVGPVTHRYADERPHTVTVIAISTACDRTGEQRATGTVSFPEQLPTPPPIESIPVPPASQVGGPPAIGSLPAPPFVPPAVLPPLPTTTTSIPAPA